MGDDVNNFYCLLDKVKNGSKGSQCDVDGVVNMYSLGDYLGNWGVLTSH